MLPLKGTVLLDTSKTVSAHTYKTTIRKPGNKL
jgi:hypothetical protein